MEQGSFQGWTKRPINHSGCQGCASPPRLKYALRLSLMIAAILTSATWAKCDDSTARFGAGGIEFLKSEDIRMVEEVLEVSSERVRVTFRFLNESDKDIHTTVAFPMPPYPPFFLDARSGMSNPSSLMTTFKVWVNGLPKSTDSDLKAIADGRDVTDTLRKFGLSDDQIRRNLDLTEDQEEQIANLPSPSQKSFGWKVAETRYWKQTFPAGKEIIVEHSYQPAVGNHYTMPTRKNFDPNLDIPIAQRENKRDQVCLDDATRQALEKRIKDEVAKSSKNVFVTLQDVEYILSTGRNWKGPIGSFTLRLVKERPDQFVSVCFPGKPKKVSPTVYEFHHRDFVPPDKLVVYFYTIGPEVYEGERR